MVGVEAATPREIAQETRAGAATGHTDAPMPRETPGGGAIPLQIKASARRTPVPVTASVPGGPRATAALPRPDLALSDEGRPLYLLPLRARTMAVTTTGSRPHTVAGRPGPGVAALDMHAVALAREPARVVGPRRSRRPGSAIRSQTARIGPTQSRFTLKKEISAGVAAPPPGRRRPLMGPRQGWSPAKGVAPRRARAATRSLVRLAGQVVLTTAVRRPGEETVSACGSLLPTPRMARTVAVRHQTPVIEGPRPSMANGEGGVLAMVVPPEPTVERVG